jgi:hypothetical protein
MTKEQFMFDGQGIPFPVKYRGTLFYKEYGIICSKQFASSTKRGLEEGVKIFKKVCDEQPEKVLEFVSVEFEEVK